MLDVRVLRFEGHTSGGCRISELADPAELREDLLEGAPVTEKGLAGLEAADPAFALLTHCGWRRESSNIPGGRSNA